MKKIEIDRDELYEKYIVKNLQQKEIAEQYNCSVSVIQRHLSKYGIKKDKQKWLQNVKKNNLKKYGVENISMLKEVKEKKKQKAIKKYGVENISQATEVKEKKKQKALEKYGVEYVLSSNEIREKIKNTCLKKYGVTNPNQDEEIRKKSISTSLRKYGVKYPCQSKIVKEKIKNTCLEKYGYIAACMNENVKEKARQTNLKKYGTTSPLKSKKVKEKIKNTCLEKYGVPFNCMREVCRRSQGSISKINKEFSKKLFENNIENKLEFNLDKYSYDIEILNTNILLEINPTYTHNFTYGSQFQTHFKKPIPKDYHFNKSLIAKSHGYRCIHIFDCDNSDKIINLLKPKKKIYARECLVKEINIEEANIFLNKYHLQGACKFQKIILGLYYNDELIEIMTFGKPRYNKNYEYELLRLCTRFEYEVVGGSQKLFKYFVKKYNPNSIISYCDNSKFNGEIYPKLGFTLKSYGKPSKHWYNMKTQKHITDNLLRQHGFDQLFKTNYGKGTSNKELMIENGFVEVYDSGQSTYIWK